MATKKEIDVLKRKVCLRGIAPIMFDRYAGDNKTTLTVEQKMYFGPDGKTLVIPSANLMSFLCAQNTPSAAKRFYDVREYKAVAQNVLSYTAIEPFDIPLTRDGKPIRFNGFVGDEDKAAGIYVHRSVARLDKGIPNPKVRPVVRLPWELSFDLKIYPNADDITEDMLLRLFQRGGLAIGLGTFRGVFGKFVVESWE